MFTEKSWISHSFIDRTKLLNENVENNQIRKVNDY